MNKVLTVAKYEYLKTVRRKAFWLTTLFLPLFMGVIMLISAFSGVEGERLLEQMSKDIKQIDIVDATGMFKNAQLPPPFKISSDLEASKNAVKDKGIDGLIYYPASVFQDGGFEVYTPDKGLLGSVGISSAGEVLLKQTAITSVPDANLQKLLTLNIHEQTFIYNQKGELNPFGIDKFIIPGVSAFVFFLSVFISAQYMLQSVAEEKENRMIENLLSIIDSKTLVSGKLAGLSAAVLTQLTIWLAGGAAIIAVAVNSHTLTLPFDLTKIPLGSLPVNFIFTLLAFFLFSGIMTGVGAIGTSYKDSQSLSSVFIILAILPIYFITIILGDPNGTISMIVSYFPLTSAMVFMIRNSVTNVPIAELLFGMLLNLGYVLIAFYLAIKMFNLGSLMYDRKPKLKEIWHLLRK